MKYKVLGGLLLSFVVATAALGQAVTGNGGGGGNKGGTITGVTAGTGLTGGGSSGAVTLNAVSPYNNFVLLTDSNNWTVPANVTAIQLCGTGGGGQGGGVGTGAAATASGGTSGEVTCGIYATTPAAMIAYTSGAGGSTSAAGNNNGQVGGNSTFGTITLSGGLGGIGSATGNALVPSVVSLFNSWHTFSPASSFSTFYRSGVQSTAAFGRNRRFGCI